MSMVWAISSGSYSDYHVIAMFTTEQQANRRRARFARGADGCNCVAPLNETIGTCYRS